MEAWTWVTATTLQVVSVSETAFNLCVHFIPTKLSRWARFHRDSHHLFFLLGSGSLTFHLWTIPPTWSSSYTIAFPLLLHSLSGDKQIISACASVVGSLWYELIWWFGSRLQSCLSFGLECIDLFAFACFISFLRSADHSNEDVFLKA